MCEGEGREFVDYQFDCKEDVDEYIELMKKLRDHFGDFIEYEHLKSEKGFFMSDSSADSVIEQCDTFLKERDNNFVTEAFNEKIDKADFLSEEEKKDYKSQNKQAMEDSVFPAFEDLKATMEELKGTGTNDKGICYYEGGKEYYENYIFPSRSGSAKTVEEEIKVMDDRMTDLIVELSSIYYSNPEAYETYYNMLEDESLYKGFYDEGGEAVIDQLQEISKKEFPIDNEIPFTIRSMGENEGKIMESALAYYRICPLDDADYNVIVENSTHYDNLFYVLAHEGCPGHMLQNWYFRNTDASNARSVCMNLGYVEGWAVYASNQVLEECDFAGVVDDPEGIAKVDKIVGPGNIFVALAKKAVFGYVSIDSIAGPSEILVLADETANPTYVAADLLSQAEHDELASAILVTTSAKLADEVESEIERFVKILSRKDIIQKSLDNFGYLLIAENKKDAIDCVNAIASEHLEIVTANPFEDMTYVKNAGAIFLGQYSSEPLGDYFAGPNHVLPTNGTARFFSALSVDDFIKKSSIISYSKEALEAVYPDIVKFANNEQLTAHANSIKVRFENV